MPLISFTPKLVSLVLLICWSGAVTSEPINDYKRALVEFYGPFGFHPFLLPEGHQVGDVIDINTLAVLKTQKECFPGLELGKPIPADIPKIALLENRAASFWVRLKSVFGVELSADETRQVRLNVEHATVTSVPLSALKSKLSDSCSELQPIFSNRLPTVLGRRAVVVSSILNGEIKTVFSFSGNVDGETKLEDLSKFLKLPKGKLEVLAPEIAARFGLSDRLNLMAGDGQKRALAYRPATIFRARLGASREPEFVPFDAAIPEHREQLKKQSLAWAELADSVE